MGGLEVAISKAVLGSAWAVILYFVSSSLFTKSNFGDNLGEALGEALGDDLGDDLGEDLGDDLGEDLGLRGTLSLTGL